MKIGPINLGQSSKRNFFDLSHDVSTTMGFGFCQPTIIKSLIPDTKVTLNTKSVVRLAPMPAPTFGRIKMMQYNHFIPMSEVFPAFDSMQSQTTVRTSIAEYIPQSADWISNRRLLNVVLRESFRLFQGTKFDMSKLLCNYAVLSFEIDYDPKTGKHFDDGHFERVFGMDLGRQSGSPSSLQNYLFSDSSTYITEALRHYFGSNSYFVQQVLSSPTSQIYSLWNETYWKSSSPLGSIPYAFGNYYSQGRSSENADFSFTSQLAHEYHLNSSKTNFDKGASFDEDTGQNYHWRLNVHLTPFGKRLFSIFNACGITFGIEKKVELNKLYAYYKAWFDRFNIGRNLTWKDTNCYKLIHTFYDCGIPLNNFYSEQIEDYGAKETFLGFINDLSRCFYNLDADPITVATSQPYNANSENDVNVNLPLNDEVSSNVANYSAVNAVESGIRQEEGTPAINSLQIQALLRLQKVVNKDSVIGRKIDDYMRVHFNYRMPQSNFVGKHEYYCQIEDTYSTVNNENTLLGEFAGKGRGVDANGEVMSYETKEFGYFIQYCTIVPLGGYVQAAQPVEIDRLDFYRSEYDSLGMEVLPMSEVMSRQSIFDSTRYSIEDKVFGFRPRYFSKKYMNNLHNGGFSFRSERAQFLPYCLDRLFSEREYSKYSVQDGAIIAPDESLRSIGLYEYYGNYDRIFYDTTGISHNFIIHMVNDFKMYAPMKPIANSYDAFDEETDNNSTSVSHV